MPYTPPQIFIGLFLLLIQCTTIRGLSCPQTFAEQKDRASNCISQDLYHCLYNEKGEVVEICKHSIWVPAGNCPEYNTGASKLNYAACQSNRGQCPPVSFLSSDLFKYLGCVPFQRIYTTPLSVLSSTHSDITENQTEETSATTYTIVLCIGIIGLAIVGLAMFISCKRRHRLQKANQKADDETVLENLVSSNEQNNTHKDSTQIKVENYPPLAVLQSMVEKLKSKKAVIIIGTWGSGKSTLANQIREYVKQDPQLANAESIGLSHLNNWQMVVPKDRISIVQLKDCVKNWYSTNYTSIIRQNFENLISKRPLCYFIILMRCSEWDRLNLKDMNIPCFETHTIFEKNKEILTEWYLTDYLIFLKVVEKQNKSGVTKLKQSFSEYGFTRNPGIGFPGLVNLICRNKRLQLAARFAMKEPVKALHDDLKRLKDPEEPYNLCHFIILVYTMLRGGKFNLNSINSDLLNKLRKLYSCEGNDPIEIFCEKPCEEYLNIETGQQVYFSLVHDIVARVLFRVVSSRNIDLLIEECDADLLLDCIVVYGYQNLKEQQRSNFAKRLRQIEQKNERPDIKYHVFLEEKDFVKDFQTASEISAGK